MSHSSSIAVGIVVSGLLIVGACGSDDDDPPSPQLDIRAGDESLGGLEALGTFLVGRCDGTGSETVSKTVEHVYTAEVTYAVEPSIGVDVGVLSAAVAASYERSNGESYTESFTFEFMTGPGERRKFMAFGRDVLSSGVAEGPDDEVAYSVATGANFVSESGENLCPAPDAECSVSGTVFHAETNEPLSAVSIHFYRDIPDTARDEELLLNVATTGPDGDFSANCADVEASSFPIRLAVEHRDWESRILTAATIDKRSNSGVNVAVVPSVRVLSRVEQDIIVTFSGRQQPEPGIVLGEIRNDSRNTYDCVRVVFDLSTAAEDRAEGAEVEDLGELAIEFEDVTSGEVRDFEEDLPFRAGFGLSGVSECG